MQASSNPDDTARPYEGMQLSLLLFRYLWPFWLFKDAGRGDRHARAAAYRYNRSMRVHLPGYLLKWVIGAALALLSSVAFGSWSGAGSTALDVYTLISAIWGLLFTCSLCVLLVTAYVYIYLSRNDR